MLIGNGGVLGIDIGSNSIKLVELEEIGTKYHLKNIGEALLDKGAIVNKVIENPEAISNALSRLIDDLEIESDDAAVSISGDPVLLKRVSLPYMTNAELKKSIKWEIEQLGSNATKDYTHDYQVISAQNSRDKIDVLIVAANKNVTKDYLSIITNVGLNPVIIDLDVFSLESMYEVNYPESEGLLALVNIGASVTNILIVDGGESVFARDLLIGGTHYTDLIMDQLTLTYEEAEEVKHNQRGGVTDPVIEQIANKFIQSISNEIKSTLEYFSTAHSKESVKRIMIGGGTASLPGLKDALSKIAGSYVGLLNPFRNINYSKEVFDPEYIEDISPKMIVATGLALKNP
ncbi:MAG: type IV pilus assembly protein PilM [Thermodesulfobacteriota bacterium]